MKNKLPFLLQFLLDVNILLLNHANITEIICFSIFLNKDYHNGCIKCRYSYEIVLFKHGACLSQLLTCMMHHQTLYYTTKIVSYNINAKYDNTIA